MLEPNVAQRLEHLAASVVDAVRLTDEGDHHVAVSRLVEDDLRMTGGDDLAAGLGRLIGEHLVDLPLAQYLQVRVGLVEEQHGARIHGHVREQEQRLLLAAPARRQIECDPLARAVVHDDLAPLLDVARPVEPRAEQRLDPLSDALPFLLPVLGFQRLPAQVAQHLRRAPLAEPHVDGAHLQPVFAGRQAGHRWQVGQPKLGKMRRYFQSLAIRGAQRPTVEGLFIGVIEFQPARPGSPLVHALDADLDEHVLRAGLAVRAAPLANVQIAPEEIGHGNRHGDEVAPVNGHARPFLGHCAAAALFQPALGTNVPQGERLQGRGLAGVVRADEYDTLAEFDFDVLEQLEIADSELGQHGITPAR